MDDQHHPEWSFVRKWNTRPCRCEQCDRPRGTPYPMGFAGQGTPLIPYSPPQQHPPRVNEYTWVTNTTNVK